MIFFQIIPLTVHRHGFVGAYSTMCSSFCVIICTPEGIISVNILTVLTFGFDVINP